VPPTEKGWLPCCTGHTARASRQGIGAGHQLPKSSERARLKIASKHPSGRQILGAGIEGEKGQVPKAAKEPGRSGQPSPGCQGKTSELDQSLNAAGALRAPRPANAEAGPGA